MPSKRPRPAAELDAMWSSFEHAILSVALDGAEPKRGLAEVARDDVGDALAAVIANLEVVAGSLGDDSRAGRSQILTAVGYARTAASRAVAGLRGWPR